MVVARGFRNSLSCRVENKLKAIKLTARKIEKKRVTIDNLGMNERRSDGLSRGIVECSTFAEGHKWIKSMI